ncbi:MAG: hypothetical protein ABID38_02955 [Candidatus Diapherotrites archaeon]
MKKFCFLLVLGILLVSSYSLAGRTGDSCNYELRGDTECDARNNIYCIAGVCTVYLGSTAESCTDSDGDDELTYGQVDFFYRASSGQFVGGIVTDGCMLDSSPVASCGEVAGCTVDEWLCVADGGMPYSKRSYNCDNGCDSGKCLAPPEAPPEPPPEPTPTPCNYGLNLDDECDTGNDYYCIDGFCTEFAGGPEIVCNDSDDANIFGKGKVTYTHRESDGGIVSGIKWDKCSNSNVIEYYCLSSAPNYGENYDSNILACESGCSIGACIVGDDIDDCDANEDDCEPQPECSIDADCTGWESQIDCQGKGHEFKCMGSACVAQCLSGLPKTVSDAELLQYIKDWADGKISDEKIMQIIEIWKNS